MASFNAPLIDAISLFDAFRFWAETRGQKGAPEAGVRHKTDVALVAETGAGRLQDPVAAPVAFGWVALAAAVASAARRLELEFSRRPAAPRVVGHFCTNRIADVLVALAAMATAAVECPFDPRDRSSDPRDRSSAWDEVGGVWLDESWKDDLESEAVRRFGRPFDRDALDEERALLGSPRPHRIASRSPHDFDAAAIILWTSGTTSRPKGVTLSHRNLVGNAAAKLRAVPQSASDVRFTSLPLCHAYARTCDFGTWLLSGCTLAVTLGFDGWRRLGPAVRPTIANVVPSLAERLLDTSAAVVGTDRLRLLGCGGAAMAPAAFESWRARGVTVIQGYGLTEAGPVICSATPDDAVPGMVGRPVDGWETRLRDGRLFVRGPHVMLGYWGAPEATAAKVDAEGWLDTGDLAETDGETGQLRVLGRADDVIVLPSGRKIHPSSVEQVLRSVAGVRHAVVVWRGEKLIGWLDLEPGRSLDAPLRGEIKVAESRLAAWQRPSVYRRFVPPLSVSSGELTGKGTVRRGRVIERRLSGQHGGHSRL